MKTIKIKLAFEPGTKITDRKMKLETWASAMLKGAQVKIIEEQHSDLASYIIVENSRLISRTC